MGGTLKLALMAATGLLAIAAVSWLLAEILVFLTKDEQW
jgi:hypothetical protein